LYHEEKGVKKIRYTKRVKKFLILSAFLLLPSLALGAGFAKQSLFLSKSPVTEGDSVRIYAVLSNETASAFAGSVVVSDGDTKIGSAAASIAAGGAQTVSVPWKPAAGSHTITAKLTASDGTVVESESATFTIAAKPVPVFSDTASPSAAAVESSQNIQNQIGSFSPAAEQASKPAFTIIDGFRSSAADFIDSQLASTKTKLANTPQPGIVAGDATQSPTVSNPWGTAWFVLYTLYLYLLTILRFLIGSAAVFYPLLAVIFFYLLYRSYKRFRRPAWER
jgi:hypothetical protein